MAKLYYESDADFGLLEGSTLAIIGYGSQGHAHALNLRDSGANVIIGLRHGGGSWKAAEADGFSVYPVAEASRRADVVMVLAPDTSQKSIYEEHIAPNLKPGNTLMFAHGFNVRYEQIEAPAGVDVSMVAPKSPGHRVRELYADGEGTPALVAVAQDASGKALPRALAYAKGIGCARAGVLETTFKEETETDLFGEQAVLCGGVSALVRAGFETLVEAGYQPEVAYFECMHELKLIVDLMYRGGLGHMWYSVSDTAEHGGYEGGARLVDDGVRERMRGILRDVQDGKYAERWIAENEQGRPQFDARRAEEGRHSIEEVGKRLRSMMGFLEAESASSPTVSESATKSTTTTAEAALAA